MGEENKGKENREPSIPPEWADIPIQDYIDKGYKPYVRRWGKHYYITLKKSKSEISLGPYTNERWKLLISMYPRDKLPSFLTSGLGVRDDEEENEEVPPPSLLSASRRMSASDFLFMRSIEGPTKGTGYLQELKDMVRAQISRTRELTETFYNFGLGIFMAALAKSGIDMDEFRKIVGEEGRLREALMRAAETAFKALDYYQSDAVKKLEEERDEARAAYSIVAAQLKSLLNSLDPKVRLEKMIYSYLLSGSVDPNTLGMLIDRWLGMEWAQVRKEVAT